VIQVHSRDIEPISDPGPSSHPSSSHDTPSSILPAIVLRLCSGVGVHLPLASGEGDVNESASVLYSLLRTALRGLLLLLRLNLWCLRLDLSGTCERTVDLSHDCGLDGFVDVIDLFWSVSGEGLISYEFSFMWRW